MARATRQPISKGLRFTILRRDGFKCYYCGAAPPDVVLHLDHVLAVANGGTNEESNLVTACLPCNLGKGVKDAYAQSRGFEATGSSSLEKPPRIEFFWDSEGGVMQAGRCVKHPAKYVETDTEYYRLCRSRMLSHGASTRGFSAYEAAMYAVEILTSKWQSFRNYVEFIDDLILLGSEGLVPDYVSPHIMRGLHREVVYQRCVERPRVYEDIADSLADQAQAAFQKFIHREHTRYSSSNPSSILIRM